MKEHRIPDTSVLTRAKTKLYDRLIDAKSSKAYERAMLALDNFYARRKPAHGGLSKAGSNPEDF
jgi:hypothetical protein